MDPVNIPRWRESAHLADVVVAAADQPEIAVVQLLVFDALNDTDHAPRTRCRSHLISLCAAEGYEPRIRFTSDDLVVMQALVAAGLGVTTIPGLALRTHRAEGIIATELPGSQRHVYAATYGESPDPPAIAALVTALAETAQP